MERVYICQREGGEYVAKYCSRPLELTNFSISETSPQITYLREQEDYLISSEFQSSPLYLSAWESEKELPGRLAFLQFASRKFPVTAVFSMAAQSGEDLVSPSDYRSRNSLHFHRFSPLPHFFSGNRIK